MTTAVFDLDLEIIPAQAPSADEIARDPQAGRQLEEKMACTPPTIDTYTFGFAMCPTCC